MLLWILLFSILGSVGAIVTAATFTLLSERVQKLSITILISYATGTLLTAALLGLIPEAIESSGGEPHVIMFVVLGGIIFFFFLEKIIIWRNCLNEDCEVHSAAGPIVLVGDAFHNFTDGIVIAAAFLTNFYVGIAAGISILIHEIPQETGDFGILLHGGFSKKKAFIYNLLSSSTTIPAAIFSYFILDIVTELIPLFLAFSAASFIYIALSDLTPELHNQTNIKQGIRQLLLVLAGVITMVLIIILNTHQH
ncbi:MAG: ZIP family metal transporter [Candidatus Lokiarchaeota archaeon]|nr:ZIP family metal transporter [Candidatus Lokiarchaeota archaeon]